MKGVVLASLISTVCSLLLQTALGPVRCQRNDLYGDERFPSTGERLVSSLHVTWMLLRPVFCCLCNPFHTSAQAMWQITSQCYNCKMCVIDSSNYKEYNSWTKGDTVSIT